MLLKSQFPKFSAVFAIMPPTALWGLITFVENRYW